MSRRLILVVVLLVATTACSSGEETATTTSAPPSTTTTTAAPTTTSTSTTSTTTTTTTTLPPGDPSPINGLRVEDEVLLDRRVMAIKIDNHPRARPQSGLQEADAVYELRVEGGISRFLAIFHHSSSEFLGPIRSARPTDVTLVKPLDAVFAISGASGWVINYVVQRGARLLGEGSGMFRIGSRRAPHNLYGDTEALRATADRRGYRDDPPPQPMFEYADDAELEGEPATAISLNWSSDWPNVNWEFDDGQYVRFIGSEPHMWRDVDGNEGQLAFDTLVVIEAPLYTAQAPAGSVSVPASDTVGDGRLLVFRDGIVVEGTWSRDSFDVPFALFDLQGDPMVLPPGVPFISIFPSGRSITWEG